MRICVCAAQSLYMTGGAELHHDNLVAALRDAGHDVELVKLPVNWARDQLLPSAFAWRLLSLQSDLVVATNFPSYFVRHPNKIVWLFHQHRAAYDALDQPWSDFGTDDRSLEIHRQLIEWDTRVLAEARRLFSTSVVVADRLRRYNGLHAEALYHPPPLANRLKLGAAGDYVFCATRLEGNKRPELMVQAMTEVTSDTQLVIAGRGSLRVPLEQQIRRLGLQRRVRLLGYVDDSSLVSWFADSLGVLYVPMEEDFGYVTLQAFHAEKPVITTVDAGGPLEWVTDGETGLVASATPTAIAAAIDRLAGDRTRAAEMGRIGRQRVLPLRWSRVVDRLVGQ